MTRIAHTHRILAARSVPRHTLATLVAGALLIGASTSHAATPEERCQNSRYMAAAKYGYCQQRALATFYGADVDPFSIAFLKHQAASDKCRLKYTAIWPRLQAQSAGTGATCDSPRFVDNGNDTVTDKLTGLQWEKKQDFDSVQNPSDPHDADNLYSWSTGPENADGTIFTNFLPALNGTCFAGQCDWRLPTIAELVTILRDERYPCSTFPCIEPIFGPTAADTMPTTLYYASSTTSTHFTSFYWEVSFGGGYLANGTKFDATPVRAVHAGP